MFEETVKGMKMIVKGYDKVKYEKDSKKVFEVTYNNVESYEVVTGDRATEIGSYTDEESRDKYNEYLVLHLTNGETATFSNSTVDLFKW